MKINTLLRPWKGDSRWTEMSGRAAAWKKAGRSTEEILAALEADYGPAVSLSELRPFPAPAFVCGEVGKGADIAPAALAQIQLALRLPVAEAGALMPDAQVGQSLPIGGVLALRRAVSPSLVGVDIGCRMHLSLFVMPPAEMAARRDSLFGDLRAVTAFGIGAETSGRPDHPLLGERDRWALTAQTKTLHAKARRQLGTSGSGNHFAELVTGECLDPDSGLPETFCGLLTHSGSRGVGYAIAEHYMRLAALETARTARVPKRYEWLDLDGDAGREYWAAMTLAGDYALACHEVLHAAFARRAGLTPLLTVDSPHNFAWREDGAARVVHRKGATQAASGVLGIIPGSMASALYLVRGLGNTDALNSASHGAGRVASRAEARSQISLSDARRQMARLDVLVDGLSADESPAAYKDIERVLQLQVDAGLLTPLARMHPVAVIMAGG